MLVRELPAFEMKTDPVKEESNIADPTEVRQTEISEAARPCTPRQKIQEAKNQDSSLNPSK